MYRGVEKAKIDPKRCAPVVASAQGCAVCTKVCPVQGYGLAAVYDEWERSATILGKGTDDLEGYWFDGEYQNARTRPKLSKTWLTLEPRVYTPPPVDRRQAPRTRQ
jgi:epoxyqueuosine reductase